MSKKQEEAFLANVGDTVSWSYQYKDYTGVVIAQVPNAFKVPRGNLQDIPEWVNATKAQRNDTAATSRTDRYLIKVIVNKNTGRWVFMCPFKGAVNRAIIKAYETSREAPVGKPLHTIDW